MAAVKLEIAYYTLCTWQWRFELKMIQSVMLEKMCNIVLSESDVKAICKSRGFLVKEVTSRPILQNFLLSDIGVAEALKKLSDSEIILLHLLNSIDGVVDISFFRPLYDPLSSNSWNSRTFTQVNQKTMQEVKQSLLRSGVLLMAEELKNISNTPQMERWRFRFPGEFAKHLPSLFKEIRGFRKPGKLDETMMRNKLLEIIGKPPSLTSLKQDSDQMYLDNGQLYIGDKLFKSELLQKWQRTAWSNAIQIETVKSSNASVYFQTPIEAVLYALSSLGADEWLTPLELSPLLKIFCSPGVTDAERICQAGHDCGSLLKLTEAGIDYYRLPNVPTFSDMEPGRYLHSDSVGAPEINLQKIPLESLDFMAQIANLKLHGQQLRISPNLAKMGRAMPSLPNHPLVEWLQENSRMFKDAVKLAAKRWGNLIIHQELLVAKIKDLSLKVLIRNTITDPEQLFFLSDDFIAFPSSQAATVEKLVNKAGHVIKWVNAK